MEPYRLGLYEKSMPDTLSLEEKLEAAQRAGYDFLELSIDETPGRLSRLEWEKGRRDQLAGRCRALGFSFGSICLSGHRRYPLGSGRPEVEARSLEIMEKALELSYDLGIRIIQLAGYDVYYEESSTPGTRERFLENLWKSTEKAASLGVVLGLETMENDFLNTVEKAMYYVETIGSPYLQVYPDVGNLTNATPRVTQDLRAGRGHIAAAHLKETLPGVFRNLRYGQGHVDFPMVTRVLRSLGVRRYTAEFWDDGRPDWREGLTQALEFLRPLL